ncbi:MAG: chemotaxis protein CheW [Syntrophomonadaceae bacterium]|jgi:purine-binding chemotaxis protein CheW|nr:chemotaxis protein CheW [Syntrophomonadaceae bacterium]
MENLNLAEQINIEDENLQVVVFRLGIEEYAVDILYVQEIKKLLSITRVPHAENYKEGVVNLRGNIIPIISFHTRFSLQAQGKETDKRIIVFKIGELEFGAIVDAVVEVVHLKREDIDEATKLYDSIDDDYISGVIKRNDRLLIVLDLKKIFD